MKNLITESTGVPRVRLTVIPALALLFFCRLAASALAESDTDAAVKRLHDPDMDVRIAALRELQVTLDPRLPREMLRLLSDEGLSIRRLAARGIGSRYWQIPQSELGDYLPTLRKLAAQRSQEDEWVEDVAKMAERAVGLLTRNYGGEMFAPSPDGKWVTYERYSMPCLIDLRRKNEELLGWATEPAAYSFASAWGGGTITDSVFWHPKSRAVAMLVILTRRDSTMWFWKPKGAKLVRLEQSAIARAAGNAHTFGLWIDCQGWKDDEFIFDALLFKDEEYKARMAWNLNTGTLRRVNEKGSASKQ